MRRVWAHFDAAGPLIGRPWPIKYQWSDERASATPQPHGCTDVQRARLRPPARTWRPTSTTGRWRSPRPTPGCLPSMTFFPEPGALDYVDDALARGARIAKLHLQVGGFDPTDPLLDDVWGRLADAGLPVVVHAGSGTGAKAVHRAGAVRTGAAPASAARRRHRAHGRAGVRRIHRSRDTLSTGSARHDDGRDRLLHGHCTAATTAIVTEINSLGTKRTNTIRYGFSEHSVFILTSADIPRSARIFGDEWLRAVCWSNAATLFHDSERSY